MLTRTRRFERPDYWILAAVGILCIIGVLMVFSSSGIDPATSNLIDKHVQWLVIGTLALIVTSTVPYTRWRRYSVLFILVAAGLLVLVELIAQPVNGAKRWLEFGPFSLQPSELAKLAFVLYLADWCSTKGEKVRDFSDGLVPFGIMLGLLGGLVFVEPDMGTMLVIFAIGITMYFISGAAIPHMLGGIALATVTFLLAALVEPYRMQRLLAFMNPWDPAEELGINYHTVQSLLALGSGGITGMGLGASRQKFGWLPEQSTDAIFSVWGQEVGFIGAVLMIALFLLIAWRGFRVAQMAPDGFSSLLAAGVTAWITAQAMINIGAVSGAIPFTGVPLPFVSYGGSSLVITLAGVGLLLNISKSANITRPDARAARNSRVLRFEPRRN
jgi:cell division protein FtsW